MTPLIIALSGDMPVIISIVRHRIDGKEVQSSRKSITGQRVCLQFGTPY